MNPGDTRSARRASISGASALNEGRGVNPGDTWRLSNTAGTSEKPTLNEGRGVNPGDTPAPEGDVRVDGVRSTKAGA